MILSKKERFFVESMDNVKPEHKAIYLFRLRKKLSAMKTDITYLEGKYDTLLDMKVDLADYFHWVDSSKETETKESEDDSIFL